MANLRIRKKRCCLTATFLFLFAVCSNSLYATNNSAPGNDSPQSVQEESKVGTIAPAFTLTSVDGKSVSLADFSNRYIVLNFWASSSTESRKMNAKIAGLEKKYKDANIVFVGISLDENKVDWQAAVNQDGLTGPQLSELKNLENADVAKLYGVGSIPTVYIISPDGCVFDVKKSDAELEQKLNEIL
jgi:peroxiredoxin